MKVVVSGSSSGIGEAIARKFLSSGHQVIGFDIKPASIHEPGYSHIVQDIRSELSNKQGLDCDILINNAGSFDEKQAVDVNLTGTISFTDNFLPSEKLKSVLFIASASARNGSEFPYYAASKAGIVGYMKNLALRVSERGITCNSISPGGVNTPSNDHILKDEKLHRAVLAETLLGKWADVDEVAELAYYMTVINRSITGEDILIDNGEMLKSNFIW